MIPLDAPDEWERALQGLPHSIVHTHGYCRAIQHSSRARTFLLTYTCNDGRTACPLAEREFARELDVYTPFGIGGFTGIGNCRSFSAHWKSVAQERGYVAGYFALNPLFANLKWFNPDNLYETKPLFVFDLRRELDALLCSMRKKRRYEVRDWRSSFSGLIYDQQVLTRFLVRNYDRFIVRKGHFGAARLSNQTLESLCSLENVTLIGAGQNDRPEAVAVFGHTQYAADYLLNISTGGGKCHSSMLIWWGVHYFKQLAVPWLNLGGGVNKGDTLEAYKRRFGALCLPMHSIQQVYLPKVYASLCQQSGVQVDEAKKYFPAYHGA